MRAEDCRKAGRDPVGHPFVFVVRRPGMPRAEAMQSYVPARAGHTTCRALERIEEAAVAAPLFRQTRPVPDAAAAMVPAFDHDSRTKSGNRARSVARDSVNPPLILARPTDEDARVGDRSYSAARVTLRPIDARASTRPPPSPLPPQMPAIPSRCRRPRTPTARAPAGAVSGAGMLCDKSGSCCASVVQLRDERGERKNLRRLPDVRSDFPA